MDSFLSISRSKEEIIMLEQEMTNILSYYKKRKEILMRELIVED